MNRPDGSPLGITTAIGEDRERNIWAVANPDRKLFRIRDMRVQEEFSQPRIPPPRCVTEDPTGGVWLGFTEGFGHYRDGKLDIIKQNSAASLTAEADGSVWVSTRAGLVRWKDGRMQTLSSKNGLECDAIYGAIRDDRRTLWLYTKCGLIGIADSELERWWREPGSVIQSTVLDALDGARPSSSPFQPIASKSPDGRLWFINDAVVQMFDPTHSIQDRPAPPVYVERLRADRQEYTIHGSAHLPPHTRDIEISYTALSYSIPQRVRFRYKLDGRDREWQDAGTRRQVFYSDLPPSKYRFRVTASNSDGVWNEAGDTVEFSIDPAYYQTTWFYASCVTGFLAMLWGLHRLRLFQIRREFNAQLDGRVDERLRIARELHDTLLQSFQGLMFSFQAARNLLPGRTEEAIRTLDKAIRKGDEAIAEGRDAIQGLRASPGGERDLEYLLAAAGQELARSSSAEGELPAFQVTVEGARQPLSPLLQDEVYRIAREILRNAFHHAHASRIELEIAYAPPFFRLRIRDNGKGIDGKVLEQGARQGHWGLPGVRERAKRIGARLKLWSEPGAGTEAELTVPARIAYGTVHGRERFRLFRRNKV
jgi:signal transduction histidine kinase